VDGNNQQQSIMSASATTSCEEDATLEQRLIVIRHGEKRVKQWLCFSWLWRTEREEHPL